MDEFWENHFLKQGTSWGFEPADSALLAANIFQQKNYHSVLLPGIGYGRNVKPFSNNKMKISGVEISQTAVSLLKDHYPEVTVHCGSVLDECFENELFDGIFAYALLHLFNFHERKKIISAYYGQLIVGGTMIFSVISPESETMKQGKQIGRNRRLMPNGLKVFFYDDEAIRHEFSKAGLVEIIELEEPIKFMKDEPPMKFKMIICEKQER